MQTKKIIMVFALLAILLAFGAYTVIPLHTTLRQTQNGRVINWRLLDLNNATTDGGGDDVPGGGIPK